MRTQNVNSSQSRRSTPLLAKEEPAEITVIHVQTTRRVPSMDHDDFIRSIIANSTTATMVDYELDEQLIEKVRERPILYCDNHLHFGHGKKTNIAWRGIGRDLNLDGVTAKKRWQVLIDLFVEHYNSYYPALGQPKTTSKKEKFKLFDKMYWMIPHIPQLSESPVSEEETEETEEDTASDKYVISIDLEPTDVDDTECDRLFMTSVMAELKTLSHKAKLKFKRDIFELLANYT